MMHLLVDELPKHPKECLFSIFDLDEEYANCKLKMQAEYDWRDTSFNGACKCNLTENKSCPYLKRLLDHFGSKKPDPILDIVEETRQKLYNRLGVPEKLIEEGSLTTATRISQYEEEKFKKHFRESIDAAIDSCYKEPRDWDDFVGNRTPINDSKYFI